MTTSLQQCLEREAELIEAFIAALADETLALLDRKASEALIKAAQAKEALANDLIELNTQRDEILAQMGLPDGYAGTEQAVGQFPELSEIWGRLLRLTKVARDKNEHNGILVRSSLQYTEKSLDALHNITLKVSPSQTYTAQGRSGQPGYGVRSIVAR